MITSYTKSFLLFVEYTNDVAGKDIAEFLEKSLDNYSEAFQYKVTKFQDDYSTATDAAIALTLEIACEKDITVEELEKIVSDQNNQHIKVLKIVELT